MGLGKLGVGVNGAVKPGKDDDDEDVDLPEFDMKKGPGRQLTETEMEEIKTNETPMILHREHLHRGVFDKHGYTDKCAGCSALPRGLHVQPNLPECRSRKEKLLGTDISVKNAKARLQERGAKVKANDPTDDDKTKKRRLDHFEDKAMKEGDPVKLNELFK
jgi:hypothetical protein